ncbi:MAG: hypothetical protein ABIW48_03020 [Burkholderiales bacterium]
MIHNPGMVASDRQHVYDHSLDKLDVRVARQDAGVRHALVIVKG